MDKLERLLNLTAALLHTARPLSADELRKRLPAGAYSSDKAAFRRTFERDKSDLRAIGVPLRTSMLYRLDPPVEGYQVRASDYAGRDLRFNPDELAALHLAASLVHLEGGAGRGLARLGASGTAEAVSADSVGELPFHDSISELMAAAAAREAVSFAYRGTRRQVEPWRLSFYRGHWYLIGWDCRESQARQYRVDRISGSVEAAGAAAQPLGEGPDPRSSKPWEFGDAEPVEVRVLVDADQSSWARHRVGSSGEPQPDGSVVFTLSVRDQQALRTFILDFLDHAEILGPPEARSALITWLQSIA